jgi:hypothetical protein
MTTQSDFSSRNVENSVAVALTRNLLALGYLIYWAQADGVETPDGFYGSYAANQAALQSDATFAARLAAAKGLLTVRGPLSASPAFVTRPSSSGTVGPQDEIPIPAVAVQVGGAAPTGNYELGSRLKWRARTLSISAFARSLEEHDLLKDALAEYLDEDVEIDVLDHDGGSLAVLGSVRVVEPAVEDNIQVRGTQFTTYGLELTAHLEYVA